MSTPYEVESVLTEKKGQPPVILEFENGKINPNLPEPLRCQLYKDDVDHSKKYVSVDNGGMSYIGCAESSNNYMHTYLAICNKKTHKVQLVKVETARASASVKRELELNVSRAEAVGENSLLDLSRKFGSKLARRVQEQHLKFRLVAKSDAHLKEVVQDKVINASDLQRIPEGNLQDLLPSCNEKASVPADVYNMNDILSEEEMKVLQEGFEAKETEEEDAFIKKCSPLFNTLLQTCLKNAKHMALLLYAEYLIRLCNARKIRGFDDICDCSEVIARKLRNGFTSKKSNERSVSITDLDKAVLRIIIINLYLSNFKLDILPLANSLRNVNTARIRLLVRVTGAQFGSATSDRATLRVPITPFNLNTAPFSSSKKRRL